MGEPRPPSPMRPWRGGKGAAVRCQGRLGPSDRAVLALAACRLSSASRGRLVPSSDRPRKPAVGDHAAAAEDGVSRTGGGLARWCPRSDPCGRCAPVGSCRGTRLPRPLRRPRSSPKWRRPPPTSPGQCYRGRMGRGRPAPSREPGAADRGGASGSARADGGSPVARAFDERAGGDVGHGALEAEAGVAATREFRLVPLLRVRVRVWSKVLRRALEAPAVDVLEALRQ